MLNNLWSSKKFTSAYLFQIEREKSCDYLLMIFMKKLRDSFKITLESFRSEFTAKSLFELKVLGYYLQVFRSS